MKIILALIICAALTGCSTGFPKPERVWPFDENEEGPIVLDNGTELPSPAYTNWITIENKD